MIIDAYQGINTTADKVIYSNEGIPVLQAKHITAGSIDFTDVRYLKKEQYNEYFPKYTPQKGDMLFANIGTIGPSTIVENQGEFLIAWNILRIVFNKNLVDAYFVHLIFDKYKDSGYFERMQTGNATKFINKDNIFDINLFMPSEVEQHKIGGYFQKLDHLITLHQRKCDETKELKKFMLQKMFPKNGEKKPEIRFEGFTDDWEQRKLDDWGDFYYGRSCPKWSVTEDATIPCIRYGELYTKFGAKIDRVYSYTNIPPENLRFSKGTEVLIPRVGEDPMDYNHCTWLSMPDIAIGEMISVFNTDNNPLFTATMFNATLQNEFAMRVEGGSVTNLYFEKLKNIEVSFPSIPEQEKIAAYFADLDHLITLHQNKCDELKKIKKFMLQNMFV